MDLRRLVFPPLDRPTPRWSSVLLAAMVPVGIVLAVTNTGFWRFIGIADAAIVVILLVESLRMNRSPRIRRLRERMARAGTGWSDTPEGDKAQRYPLVMAFINGRTEGGGATAPLLSREIDSIRPPVMLRLYQPGPRGTTGTPARSVGASGCRRP